VHRTESRGGAAHRRLDHPDTDDEVWRKSIVVSHAPEGGLRIEYLTERDRPLPATSGGAA